MQICKFLGVFVTLQSTIKGKKIISSYKLLNNEKDTALFVIIEELA